MRIEYLSGNKFYFLIEQNLRDWINKAPLVAAGGHGGPKDILDIGAGCGLTTLVYGSMFPEANVTGIDLSAPFTRFMRDRQQRDPSPALRGLKNVAFYQGNAEKTWYPDNSFDVVHYTYVLHEMEQPNGRAVLQEAMRILRPGGVLLGFEVPYIDNLAMRKTLEEFTAWGSKGESDFKKYGFHGPEPFMPYFQDFQLPKALTDAGFYNVDVTVLSQFSCVAVAHKPFNNSMVEQ